MALWICTRPPERCPQAEVDVAEMLALLPDEWVIRWGFEYRDNAGNAREGDFLVLGPTGGLMVIEVKAGGITMNPYTGQWSTADGDDPRMQMNAEWQGVIRELQAAQAPNAASLFVGRSLGAPDLTLPNDTAEHCGIKREFLLDRSDFRRFERVWVERMKQWNAWLNPNSRAAFFQTFGADATPVAIRHFVDNIDRAIMRQTEARYPLLSQLSVNPQFLVSGGVGSGKTWFALELARRWVHENRQKVLIIAYNLAFAAQLGELTDRLKHRQKLPKDSITVLAWQDLAKSLFEAGGLAFEPPRDSSERTIFYESLVPDSLRTLAANGAIAATYDALIIDEAQDHDTTPPEGDTSGLPCGWWPVYWALLHHGARARIGVFFDEAQRPTFRSGRFDATTLLEEKGFRPVRIHLEGTLRYSLPVFQYLLSLDTSALGRLRGGLKQPGPLPLGPEVEQYEVQSGHESEQVRDIVRRWLDQGWARPEQILILSRRGELERSVLSGCVDLAGFPLHNGLQPPRGTIGFGSVNRAKGLDQLAVILVDFPKWPCPDSGDQVAFFMGASRARQMLAVVATIE